MGKLLRQIVALENLSRAWEEVTDEPVTPGIDGVTVEAFARHWQANLVDLRQDVLGNRYRPAPLVRFTIPKRDGSPRLLGNLTLRDKILQRAVLRILDDIYEAFFLACSYGYRQGRSVKHAVEQVVQARSWGYTWVLDADIDEFFHSLDHHLLFRFLSETIADAQLLDLIVAWLTAHRPPGSDWPVGTPLGAIISPLLSNIYLHYLDLTMCGGMEALRQAEERLTGRRADSALLARYPALRQGQANPYNWVYIRYADDFIVLCRSPQQAELALHVVAQTLQTLLLDIEWQKTAISSFDDGFEYLGCYFKGRDFYFRYQEQWIKVDQSSDWRLFYLHGPEGYR